MEKNKAMLQLIWGVLLTLMGLALLLRSPQVTGRIIQIEYYAPVKWVIRIILYLIGLMLIGGGSRKIYTNYKNIIHRNTDEKAE
jgi:hypothetical protein